MDAYVYTHRTPGNPDRVKVGAHTGTPEKLWSRYATYHGSSQEFKLVKVEASAVVIFERFIQTHLKRNGLWIENEIFGACAWQEFDHHAQSCILPATSMVEMSKRDGVMSIRLYEKPIIVDHSTPFLNWLQSGDATGLVTDASSVIVWEDELKPHILQRCPLNSRPKGKMDSTAPEYAIMGWKCKRKMFCLQCRSIGGRKCCGLDKVKRVLVFGCKISTEL